MYVWSIYTLNIPEQPVTMKQKSFEKIEKKSLIGAADEKIESYFFRIEINTQKTF